MHLNDAAIAVTTVAAGLLVAGGLATVRRPEPVGRALADAGLPVGGLAARAIGAVEVAAGAMALIRLEAWAAAAVAAVYAAFAAFLVALIRRGRGSCGCLGERAAPPTPLHVGLNVLAAASGSALAFDGARHASLVDLARGEPVMAAPLLAAVLCAGFLAFAAVAWLPEAFGAYRGREEHGATASTQLPRVFQVGRRP